MSKQQDNELVRASDSMGQAVFNSPDGMKLIEFLRRRAGYFPYLPFYYSNHPHMSLDYIIIGSFKEFACRNCLQLKYPENRNE